MLAKPFILLLRFYQWFLSPLKQAIWGPSAACRFHPTCSEYGIIALRKHGLLWGTLLTMRRVSRCHPWGASGEDPVPEKCPCCAPFWYQKKPSKTELSS